MIGICNAIPKQASGSWRLSMTHLKLSPSGRNAGQSMFLELGGLFCIAFHFPSFIWTNLPW